MGEEESKVQDLTKIDEFLYLGNFFAACEERVIRDHGIMHVVQLFEVEPHHSVKRLVIPIRGGRTTDVTPVLGKALSYIERAINMGETVLVHCKHGRNRSASIVIAYLMAKKKWDFDTAFQYVHTKRPILRIKPKVIKKLTEMTQSELDSLLHSNTEEIIT